MTANSTLLLSECNYSEMLSKVDCGPPKDIAGASKSYNSTTYKSQVIYTCPEGETLKSRCEDDNKWTPVPSTCKVAERHFVKVTDGILDVSGKTLVKKNITADACGERCLSEPNCLAFEITKRGGNCYLTNETAASTKKMKSDKSRDYYQRINPNDEIIKFKNTMIPGEDTFERVNNVSLKKCAQACNQNPKCNSYEYHEKHKFCDQSNVTHLSHELQPSKWGWDVYIVNPDYSQIECGPPKEVVGSVKSYNSTMYKSEVTYTCPKGEKMKSMCEKNNEWTPVVSSCYDAAIYFVKVNDASLDVTGKILSKNAVTADACAERCLSDKNCLSFEMSKGNEYIDNYLCKDTNDRHKHILEICSIKNCEYWQHILTQFLFTLNT
ncbi:sushi, von Willebrand factor type A, EGF and pentraxin domain-containing protein 1-like [Octopus sinensis]|uniref:Sushi, von Willebrand factor type A, EGF and pentraxin domain-containing protein 1-like n=1 Tax=Octopus sinensis TaxID=2607531 RepID=A0A7E6F1M8_9MOLL|nr:sushi, von Willebrand factor type A, EGF and pentraxin domain-containing protein 1-like [Octopus sinensis]